MKHLLHVKGRTQTIAYWVSIVLSCYAIWRIAHDYSSANWLALSFAVYLWCVMTITAGYHRLFAHRAYSCHRGWHIIFGLTGTAFFQGSPLSWAAVHHAHHKYADTERDSHVTNWRYWVGRTYGPILKSKKAFVHLMRDEFQMKLHEYGLVVPLLVCAITLLIDVEVFLFGYALPLGVFFLFSNIHQSFSHYRGSPRDQPWLEFVFPACGEWTHKAHHDNPRSWRFGAVDLGAAFIQRIRHD